MLSLTELTSTARARLKDARALLSKRRYDGAAYVSGYAVEIALKARIVKTLKWPGFPSENNEFTGLQSFKTHNLRLLLYLCGWEARMKARFPAAWSRVLDWNPESRYLPPGNVTQLEAEQMVEYTKNILRALL